MQEAEKSGFTSEDVQVAVNHSGDMNPITWLTENWANMIDTVMTLASNVGHEAEENTTGTISKAEAKEALRKHKGNIWASVTECVEGRQQKVAIMTGIELPEITPHLFFSMRSCRARGISPERTRSPC